MKRSKLWKCLHRLNRIKDYDPYYQEGKPSKGSTYSKDCLVIILRELKSPADVSFYKDMLPYVQTPDLILSQRETIFSKLVSGLQIEAKFSLPHTIRLIASFSRDLSEEFIPFLPRFVNSLVILLKNGGEKDPRLISEIITLWRRIMIYLRDYFISHIECFLRYTLELRYYPNDCFNEKMSKAMSVMLRQAPASELEKGIKLILSEVSEQPERAARAGFLYFDMTMILLQS